MSDESGSPRYVGSRAVRAQPRLAHLRVKTRTTEDPYEKNVVSMAENISELTKCVAENGKGQQDIKAIVRDYIASNMDE